MDDKDQIQSDIQSLVNESDTTFTTIGDRRIVWRCWGAGPVRVLIHGGSGSWTHWIRNLRQLAARNRLLVPDLPGTGDSDLPARPFDRDALIDSTAGLASDLHTGLTQILQGLDERTYSITGFSLGSIVGTYLAAVDATRCQQLVLVGTSALGEPLPPVPTDIEPLDTADSEEDALERQGRNLRRIMLSSHAAIDPLAKRLQLDNVRRARIRTHWLARSDTLAWRLSDVRAPVISIWGEDDIYAAPDLNQRIETLHQLQPDAMVHTIPNAGHWVMYEQADAFNAIHATLDSGTY